ncbi:MAG: long-chain fatty acid--CoA ligase [Kofleriaceae bacterium]|nr:long-chain fatty acid--CoA ligase [Kofleriaceae bacterium]
MATPETLVAQLFFRSQKYPDKTALREKRRGLWTEVSWKQYWGEVVCVAKSLEKCGVKAGDGVGILSDNRPEWLYADLGAQLLGARGVGIYQTNPPDDVAYVVNDSSCVVLFCEDQEQVDKAVEIADKTECLRHIVVFDSRGTRGIADPRLMSWDEFLALGQADKGGEWEQGKLDCLDPDAPAMVIYTSGTTGAPKGALISSRNALATSEGISSVFNVSDADTVLSYLPLCHVAEKIFSLFMPMSSGVVVHFGESIGTVQADLRQVSPTIFLGVPRIWEKMQATVTVKMQNSSWLKRKLFDWAKSAGDSSVSDARNGTSSFVTTLKRKIAYLLIFRPLLEKLGMRRCRIPVSGAAPIGADLLTWYHGIGLPVLEAYGMTECAGVSHINPPGQQRIGTVGKVAPSVECKISETGDILVRGPNVFCGYLGLEEASAEMIDSDGWLHTGDIGSVDEDGYLRITGRKKGIIITSGGKNLSPEKIENAIKISPYVKEAIAVGEKRNFISALIQIEFDVLSDWATRQKIVYTSFADLCRQPEVMQLIDEEIQKANESLARVEQVRSFRLIEKELSQEDGELTATQKVRRAVVIEAFDHLVEEIYGGKSKKAPILHTPIPKEARQ